MCLSSRCLGVRSGAGLCCFPLLCSPLLALSYVPGPPVTSMFLKKLVFAQSRVKAIVKNLIIQGHLSLDASPAMNAASF